MDQVYIMQPQDYQTMLAASCAVIGLLFVLSLVVCVVEARKGER